MAPSSAMRARLARELQMLEREPPPGVCAWLKDDRDIDKILAQVNGVEGTPYASGVFLLEVAVPDRYPFEPPKVRFLTPIYHPNIDSGGRICLDTLKMPPKGAWTPSLNLSTVLSTIRLLMSHPNPDDGLVPDITEQYRNDPAAFELEARTRTATHATADRNGQLQDEKPASALLTATADPPEAPPTTEAEGPAAGPACDSHADTESSQLQVANVPATKPQSKLKKRRRLTASHTG